MSGVHKGPDVSQRARKSNGEFADENKTSRPDELPAGMEASFVELADQLTETDPGSDQDVLRGYDEQALARLADMASVSDEDIDSRYPVQDVSQLERDAVNADSDLLNAKDALSDQAVAELELIKQEETRLRDEASQRYEEKRKQSDKKLCAGINGSTNMLPYMTSKGYVKSLQEYSPQNYKAIMDPNTVIDKVAPYKRGGETRYRFEYTMSNGASGKVTFPQSTVDLTGEKNRITSHQNQIGYAQMMQRESVARGYPAGYEHDGQPLECCHDTNPKYRDFKEAQTRQRELRSRLGELQSANQTAQQSRGIARMQRDTAKRTLEMHAHVENMRLVDSNPDGHAKDSPESHIFKRMPNLQDSGACDLRGISPDGETLLIARHRDRFAEYQSLGYRPDSVSLQLVDRDGSVLTGSDGKPLTMLEQVFVNPLNKKA